MTAKIRIGADEAPPSRSAPGADRRKAVRWTWGGAALVVLLTVTVLGAAMGTLCGPVWAPVAAAAAAFVSGYTISTVHWHAWAHARVDAAVHDPLTGLPTRTVLEDKLDAVTRAGAAVTVALADVDGLHAINANFGHAAGDQYLTAVAYRLARAVPAGGLLVRQSGDEFTMLVPGVDADGLATAIGAAMAGPAVIAGYRIQPRVSVGIATSDGGVRHGGVLKGDVMHGGVMHGDARHARARADVAMFAAKVAGGNHVRIWDRARHGEPAADGTRPVRRRRDIDLSPGPGVAWQPASAATDLIPLLLPPADARLVYQALTGARDAGTDTAASDRRSGFARLAARLGSLLDPDPSEHNEQMGDGHRRREP
ncbi:GGDEF domain-containing protein [Virgisporangium aurantiacum]|uniref:GGDEF domain-containing protein n=1 Tax=Virgisporangium aurantiacum TaxID=175570 RepID=A0A8J3ZNY0_9ACTN|nr:GGDEF domain-containing protein [Virgisporangium aurantiacum]GIJ64910.1 hypothetical protein Vau01_124260 [Virgisporangium aurantiacum]